MAEEEPSLNYNSGTEKNKRWGLVATGVVGGTLLALYAVATPFVSPALRKICLPFVPATEIQMENIFKMLMFRSGTFVDIGSGDGRIVIAAAKKGFQAVGYELNPWLVWYSRYRAWKEGVHQNTKFHISDLWKITNGTRQGCPLSPIIFALCMEPLAERIRTINITGIRVGQMEHRIGLYADDVVLSCVNLETSLTAIILELGELSNVSYYRLNPTKSLLFPVAVPCAAKSKMEAEFPFTWMTEGIPYLGVILTGSEQIVEKNFSKLITQVKSQLDHFHMVMTSWIARINVFKMMILPKILYLLRCIPLKIPKRLI
ncbi:ATP synthase subunit C lysine N-methyltransferase isoform X1 [Dendrobates tinctorius]|uniref:ATP synthase subunit C lysine N-methyltransferase isoform X1 n=1 Tax=Dendrobates tinctorius TaxID=92724 RepID=UPI003CC9CABE